jgi:hypothetical protein
MARVDMPLTAARCTRLHPQSAGERRLVACGRANQAPRAVSLARVGPIFSGSPADRLLPCVRFCRRRAFGK